jgi:hypothetical protein
MAACANAIWDAVKVRVDQVPIQPHMILKALAARRAGGEARYGPRAFPAVDFGETLLVPTPAEGGDGKAINEWKVKLRSGMRSTVAGASGTMSEREQALKAKDPKALTTS